MRYSASEKYEIIQLVQHSDLSVKRDTLVNVLEQNKPHLSRISVI